MRTTINQLNAELQAIATAHMQINSYYWGSMIEAIHTTALTYPLMNCFYPTGSILDNTTPIQLYIEISDKVYKDRTNLNDTESDTLQVCRAVFNVINKSGRWNSLGRVESATVSKFWERSADEVAGHTMVINFTLFDTNTICALPLEDYDFDSTYVSSCADAVVLNSDSSYNVSVPSGGSLTLPNTTFNIYVNGILNNSVNFATLSNQTININN